MSDKNGHINKVVSLSAKRTKNNGISTYQFERELLSRLFEHIKRELESGNMWRGQLKSREKDGSDWIAQTVIVPVVDDELGQIKQHIAIKQDITEQINHFNQLERYRNLMNAASDAIFIHDLNGLFTHLTHQPLLGIKN